MLSSLSIASTWKIRVVTSLVGIVFFVFALSNVVNNHTKNLKQQNENASIPVMTTITESSHRQLAPTEYLHLRIIDMDRNSAADDGKRLYYVVKARVRVVTESASGLETGNIIYFDTWVNDDGTTTSPIPIEKRTCIFAKLNQNIGRRYVLADGISSLNYATRRDCSTPEERDPGLIGRIIIRILERLIPGIVPN